MSVSQDSRRFFTVGGASSIRTWKLIYRETLRYYLENENIQTILKSDEKVWNNVSKNVDEKVNFPKRKAASPLESVPIVVAAKSARESPCVPTSTAARSTRLSTPSDAASASVSSPPAVLEDDVELSFEIPPLVEAVEGVPFPDATTEIETPSARVSTARVSDTLRQDEPTTSRPADGPSSPVNVIGKGVAKDGHKTGCDLDTKEMRMMGEGLWFWKLRVPRERRSVRPFSEDGEKIPILEGTLRTKEEELKVSKVLEAQCGNLQPQVVSLRAELEECQLKLNALISKVAKKAEDHEKAELARLGAIRKAKALEIMVRVLRSERENALEMVRLKEKRLNERIGKLAKEASGFFDRVTVLEAEKAQLLVRSSFSRGSGFPNVPRDIYEEWIHAEAQLDILRDLMSVGTISEVVFEDARVKSCRARVACGYDPAIPKAGDDEEDVSVDQIEEDA
ncbi:uncharacterized protein [Nicotiana sylvestris]|uniref:uncharacterized protein n=1 Tax=Nicotiana sylvestris TaxID=4096 RepID=UPI00388CDEC1